MAGGFNIRSILIGVFAMVSFIVASMALGHAWVEVALAISVILLLAFGAKRAQSWIEQRTGRTVHPGSEFYDATFYGIGLGICLPLLAVFQEMHPITFIAMAVISFTLATFAAIALFGAQDSGREKA